MRTVEGRVVQLAQHKYASNVVEKCVEKSNEADRRTVVLVSQGNTGGHIVLGPSRKHVLVAQETLVQGAWDIHIQYIEEDLSC
jgi:hypothetical protein